MKRPTVLLVLAIFSLLAGSVGANVFALTSVNMYPDFSVAPSSDTGCAALTSAVSSFTGNLDAGVPTTGAYHEIDQEDTSYTSGASGASFCSYQYTGTTITLSSASATLFLMESGPSSDNWPVTVYLYDLTACTTYTASSPCTPIASASVTLTGVINQANVCDNSESFSVPLTLSGSAQLTNGHLYGLVVSAASNSGNGFNELNLCAGINGPRGPTVVSVTGGSTVTGVPQFPYGVTVLLGVGMVGLAILARRASIKSSTVSASP